MIGSNTPQYFGICFHLLGAILLLFSTDYDDVVFHLLSFYDSLAKKEQERERERERVDSAFFPDILRNCSCEAV
jgi:hypothetical protein